MAFGTREFSICPAPLDTLVIDRVLLILPLDVRSPLSRQTPLFSHGDLLRRATCILHPSKRFNFSGQINYSLTK